MATALQIVRLDRPDEVRTFPHGRFELYRVGNRELGRAVYEPGWRWSQHIGPIAGTALCEVDHTGLVLGGRAAVRMADGAERVLSPGDFFAILWVPKMSSAALTCGFAASGFAYPYTVRACTCGSGVSGLRPVSVPSSTVKPIGLRRGVPD